MRPKKSTLLNLPQSFTVDECLHIIGTELISRDRLLLCASNSTISKGLLLLLLRHEFDAFISYDSKPKDYQLMNKYEKIAEELRKRHFSVFYKADRVGYTYQFSNIQQDLTNSIIFLPLVTISYVQRVANRNHPSDSVQVTFLHCQRQRGMNQMVLAVVEHELKAAVNKWEGPVGYMMNTRQFVDLSWTIDETAVEGLAQQLIAAIQTRAKTDYDEDNLAAQSRLVEEIVELLNLDDDTAADIQAEAGTFDDRQQTEQQPSSLTAIDPMEIARFLQQGKAKFNRGKLCLYGAGRQGKTAVARALMGEDYQETASTVGIEESLLQANLARGQGKEQPWMKYELPEKLTEAAIARELLERKNKQKKDPRERQKIEKEQIEEGKKDENSLDQTSLRQQPIKRDMVVVAASSTSATSDQILLPARPVDQQLSSSQTTAAASSMSNHSQSQQHAANHSIEVDEAYVAKYLADRLQFNHAANKAADTDKAKDDNDDDLVISLLDFGGQEVFHVIHHLFITPYSLCLLVFNMEMFYPRQPSCSSQSQELTELLATGQPEERDDTQQLKLAKLQEEHRLYTERQRTIALQALAGWIDVIIAHTYRYEGKKKTMAPIILVGSHHDRVQQREQHVEIDRLLRARFADSLAWDFLLPYSQLDQQQELCFYPVDNTLGRGRDPVLQALLASCELHFQQADYVQQAIPLAWLKALDKLTRHSKEQQLCYLSYRAVQQLLLEEQLLAKEEEGELQAFLRFMHRMNVFLWLEGGGEGAQLLQEVIIFDPIAFFVTPATRIIRRLQQQTSSNTAAIASYLVDTCNHEENSAVHKAARIQLPDDYAVMKSKGLLSHDLLCLLLAGYEDRREAIIQLLIKFVLIVPMLLQLGRGGGEQQQQYIVPALLPKHHPSNQLQPSTASSSGQQQWFFAFSMYRSFHQRSLLAFPSSSTIGQQPMQSGQGYHSGFLPAGFFQRLLAKAIAWSQQTMENDELLSAASNNQLYQTRARLVFGRQRFLLEHLPDMHCLRVEMLPPSSSAAVTVSAMARMNPLALHAQLCEMLDEVLRECAMPNLQYSSWLQLANSQSQSSSQLRIGSPALWLERNKKANEDPQPSSSLTMLSLSKVQKLLGNSSEGGGGSYLFTAAEEGEEEEEVKEGSSRILLSSEQLLCAYDSWRLPQTGGAKAATGLLYDIFLSYRWSEQDSALVTALYDQLSIQAVEGQQGSQGSSQGSYRLVEVFHDRHRLQAGRDYRRDFARAMTRSALVLPIITPYALQRMIEQPDEEDNLLLEWILALGSGKTILPILLGHEEEGDKDGTAAKKQRRPFDFAMARNQLPDTINEATLELLTRHILPSLPSAATVNQPPSWYRDYSAKRVFFELTGILGVTLSQPEDIKTILQLITKSSLQVLQQQQQIQKDDNKEASNGQDEAATTAAAEKSMVRPASATSQSSKSPDPATLLPVATAVTATVSASSADYTTAFSILLDPRYIQRAEALTAYLQASFGELGIAEAADLEVISAEEVQTIASHLTVLGARRFLKAMQVA